MRRILVILAVLTVLAAPAGAQISLLGLKNSLFQFALEQISVPGELEIQAEGVEDAEDGATDIVGLTVADAEGVWLQIGRVSLRWNASRIVTGELEISRLAASDVTVLRAPAASAVAVEANPDGALAEPAGDLFDWPRSPIATRVDELLAERVTIAPGVIATQGLSLDLTGALRDEGDEQSLTMQVTRTDQIAGAIALSFLRDFAAERLDLDLKADEAAGGLVAELAGFPATSASRVALNGQGPVSDWAVTLDASSDGVFTAAGYGALNTVGGLKAKLNFTLTPGDQLAPDLRAALSPNARIVVDVAEDDGGVIRINQGDVTSRDLSLSASGAYDQTDTAVDLALRLEARPRLADLVEGVDFVGLSFDGAAKGPLDDLALTGDLALSGLATEAADVGSASLRADVRLAGDVIDGAVDGVVDGVRLDRIEPALIGPATLVAKGRFAGDIASLEVLSLTSKPLSVLASGEADLAASAVGLTYTISAPDLAPFAAAYDVDAAGAIEATGAVSGDLTAPDLGGEAAFTGLGFDGEPLGAVTLTHRVALDETPSGDLNLSADGSRFGAVTFDGGFELAEDQLTLSDLAATGLGAKIAGDLAIDLAATLVSGRIDLDAPDLNTLSEAAGQPLAGALSGEVVLTPTEGAQDVGFDLNLSDIRAAGVALSGASAKGRVGDALGAPVLNTTLSFKRLDADAAQVASGKMNLKGMLDDLSIDAVVSRVQAGDAEIGSAALKAEIKEGLSDDPDLRTRLTARSINAGPASLPAATLTANGRLSRLSVELKSDGALESGESISVDAAALVDAIGPVRATVSRFDAALDEARVELDSPLTITTEGAATRFKGIALSLAGAALTGDAALYPNGASGELRLAAPDLSPLAALADLPIAEGGAWVDATFNTRRSSAGAKVKLTANDLKFDKAIADIGAVTVDGDVDWNGRSATTSTLISGPFGKPISARVTAPLVPSGGPAPRVPQNGPLSGALTWDGEIGEIWALVPAPGHVLSGDADVALEILGTVASPDVGGSISLSSGRYENLDVGAILTDLVATSRIAPGGAFAIDLKADDGAKGQVSATVSLADGQVDAVVKTDQATLVRRDDVTAAMSVDIKAAGPVAGPDITGVIVIDRAEARLINANPPGVADIGDVRIKGEEPPEPEPASGEDIALDLTITGPQNIFVRGRGLDSEWSVDLKVSGTAAAPRITGAVERRRGVLNLLGAQFDLERGTVRFNGGKTIDPTLDVLIQRDNDGIRGGIAVTGSANDPQINFVSRPAIPEEEVLPRVLFGRSRQSLSPTEALSLGVGLATLLDGGEGAIGGARSAAGLDVLRVDTGEEGPSVTVGSNVADGVFVGAKQPIGSGSASVQVEVEVFDNVTIDSEFGPDVGTSIGLNWKKDF